MSSCLNALAAVTWEDFLKPFTYFNTMDERRKTWVTRLLVGFYGMCGIAMSFMAMNLGGTVLQASLSFTGAASGPLLGIFCLGAFFPWANYIGAIVGSVFGLVIPMWISIGAYSITRESQLPFPTNSCSVDANVTMTTAMPPVAQEFTGLDKLYTVSYLWYPSIGAALVVVIGMVVSLITGPMDIDEIDPKYLVPFFDRIFCCLPAKLRWHLRCKKDFKDPKDICKEKDIEIEIANSISNGTPVVNYVNNEQQEKKISPESNGFHHGYVNGSYDNDGYDIYAGEKL